MADFDFQQTAQKLQDFVNTVPEEIEQLRALYESLTQTGVTPVAAADWPVSNPQENVIYRVAGTSSYTDYMWNGTDFIPMATYTNTPTDTPIVGSTDVITAGGVANHGSAFDISEYNKNGTTLATYADLSAALAAVPSTVQKGGMSVKFVQSYDNNYVQYRLTKMTFSTTESDWQKEGSDFDFASVFGADIYQSNFSINSFIYTKSIIDRANVLSLSDVSQYRFYIDYLSWNGFKAGKFYFQFRISSDDFQTESTKEIAITKSTWQKGEWISGKFSVSGIDFIYNLRATQTLTQNDSIAAAHQPVPLFDFAERPHINKNGATIDENINGIRATSVNVDSADMLNTIAPVILEQKIWVDSSAAVLQSMGVLYTGGKIYFGLSNQSGVQVASIIVPSSSQPTGIKEYRVSTLISNNTRVFMYVVVDWDAYSRGNTYSLTTGVMLKVNDPDDASMNEYFGERFYCTPNDNLVDFFTLYQGKTIVLTAGNYDILSHYEERFGNDYWTNYSGYSSGFGSIGAGLPLYKGTRLICSPAAKITCNYQGNNPNVTQYFSAFACGDGYEIDGMSLICSNIRYAIHDDFNSLQTQFNVTIRNSHIENSGQAIGGGLGVCGNYLLENNYIKSSNNSYDMRYHNNVAEAKNRLTFVGNYFYSRLRIANYGVSAPHTTECFVSNNSMADTIIHNNESSDYNIENIEVIEWNNVIRS